MKIALIDNNDSFTYNVVDYLRQMEDVVLSIIPTHKVNILELEKFDKIILSPGPGLPKDFVNLNIVIKEFYKTKPILGICLGHQAIAKYFGAKLINISPVIHGQAHELRILNRTQLFQKLPLKFKVGLYHSWAVGQEDFPEDLSIDAYSEQNIIMSFSVNGYPIWGVQFHPESHITEYGFEILQNFIEL